MLKKKIKTIINNYPVLKRIIRPIFYQYSSISSVSSGYIAIDNNDLIYESERLKTSWQSEYLPIRQKKIVDHQLNIYRRGGSVDVFDVIINALKSLPDPISGMRILEIGCASGYYSEVLDIARLNVEYVGCDYSEEFIKMARLNYPQTRFDVEDGTSLTYDNSSFDIVISGCCLLHIPEYQQAITETARVSKRYAIFHRTPVVWGNPDQWYRKEAYGVETIEIHFNEEKLIEEFSFNDLDLIGTYTLHEESDNSSNNKGKAIRTYLCQKR